MFISSVTLSMLVLSGAPAAPLEIGGTCQREFFSWTGPVRAKAQNIGVIPRGATGVTVHLYSNADVDLGAKIDDLTIGTRSGNVFSTAEAECSDAFGSLWCYSGFFGTQQRVTLGHESLSFASIDTNATLFLSQAFDFKNVGTDPATVSYSYCPAPTTAEFGSTQSVSEIQARRFNRIAIVQAGELGVRIQFYVADPTSYIVRLSAKQSINFSAPTTQTQTLQILDDKNDVEATFGPLAQGSSAYVLTLTGRLAEPIAIAIKPKHNLDIRTTAAWGPVSDDISAACSGAEDCAAGICGALSSLSSSGICRPVGSCQNEEVAAVSCAALEPPKGRGVWGCEDEKCVWRNKACTRDQDCGSKSFCGYDAASHRVCRAKQPQGGICAGHFSPSSLFACRAGLFCAQVESTFDLPGSCQQPGYCENSAVAAKNCASVPLPGTPGTWTCVDRSCVWASSNL